MLPITVAARALHIQAVAGQDVNAPAVDLHLDTIYVVATLALIIVATAYGLTAVLRHNDHANRILCASLIVATTTLAIPSIWGSEANAPALATAASRMGSVYAVALLWSGTRALNQRKPRLWIPLLAGAASGAVALSGETNGSDQVADFSTFILLATFAWLAGVGLRSGPLRANLNSQLLRLSLWSYGLIYALSAGVLAGMRASGRPHDDFLSAGSSALLFVSLFLLAAVCLSAMRAERYGSWRSGDGAFGELQTALDAISMAHFEPAARDRLERMSHVGGQATLLVAEVNNINELNTAFGREIGDIALTQFIEVLRAKVPAAALIGHLDGGRFVVLAMSTSPRHARDISAAITTGLLNTDVKPASGIRLGASFGSANTWVDSPSYDELLQAAADDLAASRT